MAVDIGAIAGLIILKDEFTSQLDLAAFALKNFSKENQESLKAVAGAAGIVTAAFTAVAVATVALGNRGSDINDVNATLVDFAGGAREAEAAMEALRSGTKNTVENFTLAKDAAHLLSAGVRLTADDFGTLGSAAFVLQNRGLGDTKKMLELVSDAMVTGRTRALSMALGVVEVDDAEAAYAKTLGIKKDEMTDLERVEAKRIAIMGMLQKAVKEAGDQERDFGEQLEAGQVALTNWIDELAQAVAVSPALAAGMKAVGDAFSDAFSGENSTMIADIVHQIENVAIVAVDVGLGAIEMARVVNVAWSGIKVAVLSVLTVVAMVADGIVETMAAVAIAGNALHVVPDSAVAEVVSLRDNIRGLTVDLGAQTDAAALGLIGQSELDKTLDHLGGTLFTVRDAMVKAQQTQTEGVEVDEIAIANAKKIAEVQGEVAKAHGDRAKIEASLWAIEKKSLEETTELWDKYFVNIVKQSGTTYDALVADIEASFNIAVTKLDAADRNYAEHYKALRATADQALKGIASDWDSVKDTSIRALNQTAERAEETYRLMIRSGGFHYDALERQRLKVIELQDAARGMGKEFVAAQEAAAAAAEKNKKELIAVKEAADKAAAANRAMGGSSDVTAANISDQMLKPWGVTVDMLEPWFRLNYSLQDAIAFAKKYGRPPKGQPQGPGPRVTGYAEGGMVDIKVGENGPEAVRIPLGSTVFPSGMRPSGGGTTINNWYVNGSALDVVRQIKQIIMRELKSGHQFGSA